MTDIALSWDNESGMGDLTLTGGALALDDGLRTAILISLFTDARAAQDDELPDRAGDRRGWWGNAFPVESGDAGMGSRLWLLSRAKALPATLVRARAYARDALQWLIDDRIASALDIDVRRERRDATEILMLTVALDRPGGEARLRYDFAWEASA